MNTLEKDFVPYEQALALKELEFNEPCLAFYNHQSILIMMAQENEEEVSTWKNSYVPLGKQYAAPTFSQAFRWFREKRDWQHSIEPTADQYSHQLGYNYWIWNYKTGEEYHTMPKNRPSGDWEYKSYEEAELACLIKLIEIANEQQ